MNQELRGKADVDEMHVKFTRSRVGEHRARQTRQQAVEDEVAAARGEDDRIEYVGHRGKKHHRQHQQQPRDTEQDTAESLGVVPETHFSTHFAGVSGVEGVSSVAVCLGVVPSGLPGSAAGSLT